MHVCVCARACVCSRVWLRVRVCVCLCVSVCIFQYVPVRQFRMSFVCVRARKGCVVSVHLQGTLVRWRIYGMWVRRGVLVCVCVMR